MGAGKHGARPAVRSHFESNPLRIGRLFRGRAARAPGVGVHLLDASDAPQPEYRHSTGGREHSRVPSRPPQNPRSIVLSPALQAAVQAVGVERGGVYAHPKPAIPWCPWPVRQEE
jgi:hypothetical protein